jgi:hypothetical protein
MIDGEQYYDYFLHQAETHPMLLHTADNLAFAQVSVEEAFGDLRSASVSASGYIMRLIQPVFRLAPGSNGEPGQTFDGGFLIARTYDKRNQGSEDYRQALYGSERVAVDIVEKMYADSNAGHPMFQGKAHSSLTLSAREKPVTGDAGYGGWLILWSLPNHFTYCTPAESAAWADGGLTPFAQ